MKARHRKSGGVVTADVNPPSRTADAEPILSAARERKRGGKTVKMSGKAATMHAGRKPRKSGGRAGSNMNPLSSAASGTPPTGHKVKGC
jgi:hypothetical protein